MAYFSITEARGTGTYQILATPEYMLKEHITVYVDGLKFEAFEWITDRSIQLIAPLNRLVRVVRRTSPELLLTDYKDGTQLPGATLRTDSVQAFYMAQEAYDLARLAGDLYGADPTPGLELTTQGIMDLLNGQIQLSALAMSLREEIGLIRGPADLLDSPAWRVAQEALARSAEMRNERDARVAALLKEAGDRDAAINVEKTARTAADTALAQQVTTLTASTGAAVAAFQQDIQALTTADEALSSSVTLQGAQIDGALASIATESTARANADNAIASSVENIRADLETADTALSARVDAESLARSTADEALALRTSSLEATVSQGMGPAVTARIDNLEAAMATADTANATAIQNVQSSVATQGAAVNALDTRVSTVQTQADTTANKVGTVESNWTLKVQARADGKRAFAGIGLSATAGDSAPTQSEMVFMADKMMFVPSQADVNWVPQPMLVMGLVNNVATLVVPPSRYGDKLIEARMIVEGTIEARHVKAKTLTVDQIDTKRLDIRDDAGNVLLGVNTPLAYALAAAGTKNSEVPVGDNLIRHSDFSVAGVGGWGGGPAPSNEGGISAIGLREMYVRSRDNIEYGNDIPVTPGERIYGGMWAWTQGTTYPVGIGLYYMNAAGNLFAYECVGYRAAGQAGGWLRGSIVVPAGAVKAVPWIQISGSSNLGYAAVSGIYLSRSEPGATVGARAGVNLLDQSGAALTDESIKNSANASGTNLLYNADFSNGMNGWWVQPGSGFNSTIGINLNNDYRLAPAGHSGTDVLFMEQLFRAGNPAYYHEILSYPVQVTPGKRYCFSGYTGAHRCHALVYPVFFNAAGQNVGGGTHYSNALQANLAEAWGGVSLASYKRCMGFIYPPADASYARLCIRKYDTLEGSSNSYAFFTRLQVEEVGAQATAPGAWVPSGVFDQSTVRVGNPITYTNISSYIAGAAIGNAQIGGNLWSDNYSQGGAGWIIRRDGSAEFRNVIVRGDIQANSLNGQPVGTAHIVDNAVTSVRFAATSSTNRVTASGVELPASSNAAAVVTAAFEVQLAAYQTNGDVGTISVTPTTVRIRRSPTGSSAGAGYVIWARSFGEMESYVTPNTSNYVAVARTVAIEDRPGLGSWQYELEVVDHASIRNLSVTVIGTKK